MSLLEHKKARLNYEILETFEAGIELLGTEVKSLREKRGKLEGAFIGIRGNEAYLIEAEIPPYQPANTSAGYDATRARKLLLSHKEIEELAAAESQKGLTIIPISVYNKGSKIKVSLAIARGKKKFDKRADIKAHDAKREMDRTLKRA